MGACTDVWVAVCLYSMTDGSDRSTSHNEPCIDMHKLLQGTNSILYFTTCITSSSTCSQAGCPCAHMTGDNHVCLPSLDSSLVYIWVCLATRLKNVWRCHKLSPQAPKPSRNPDPKTTALPIPGGFILEGSVVQPQLQVMGLLPHSNVELLCAAHDILVMTLSWRLFLFLIRSSCMLCLLFITAHQ